MSIFPCGWAGITGPGEPGYEKKPGLLIFEGLLQVF